MALLAQYCVLQLLDMITTVVFLSAGVQEGNPIVAQAIRWAQDPVGALMGVKLIAIAIGVYCFRVGRLKLLRRINWLFAVLVMWNVVAICVAARHIS
jgi:hypothetical protein